MKEALVRGGLLCPVLVYIVSSAQRPCQLNINP
jgi:hypothetical protein